MAVECGPSWKHSCAWSGIELRVVGEMSIVGTRRGARVWSRDAMRMMDGDEHLRILRDHTRRRRLVGSTQHTMPSTPSIYNHSRTTRQILKRHRRQTPSFTLHLHPSWFRFEDPKGRLLLEEAIPDEQLLLHAPGPSRHRPTPMTPGKELLSCIRDQRVPNLILPVLDARRIPFFEGETPHFCSLARSALTHHPLQAA